MEVIRDWSVRQKGVVATESLYKIAKEKAALYEGHAVVNVCYTDYGGTFADKVIIACLKKNYPQVILSEYTSWNGENAFIFGELADEIARTDSYLCIEEFEDFFLKMKREEEEKAADRFINDYFEQDELSEEERIRIWQTILTFFEEDAHIETFGVDYCEDCLKDYLQEELGINLDK